MKIGTIQTACYRIPLPVPLSDSTHGEMPDFQLVTARLYDDAGLESLGYTYTVGRGGKAIVFGQLCRGRRVLGDRHLETLFEQFAEVTFDAEIRRHAA